MACLSVTYRDGVTCFFTQVCSYTISVFCCNCVDLCCKWCRRPADEQDDLSHYKELPLGAACSEHQALEKLKFTAERGDLCKLTVHDKQDKNVFHHAAEGGNPDVIAWFHKETKGTHPDLHKRLSTVGETPLHSAAARKDNSKCLQQLIDIEADVNAKSSEYGTPLFSAFRAECPQNVFTLMKANSRVEDCCPDGRHLTVEQLCLVADTYTILESPSPVLRSLEVCKELIKGATVDIAFETERKEKAQEVEKMITEFVNCKPHVGKQLLTDEVIAKALRYKLKTASTCVS